MAVQKAKFVTQDTSTINVRNVSKWYGSVVAVNDVSFKIRPGITGLLGPNGAGKSTLLKMVEGLTKVSEGEISILGQRPRNNPDLYKHIGILSEQEAVYGFYTGRQFVEFVGRLHQTNPLEPAVALAIDRVGLSDAQDRHLGKYSRGMKQRIRLAAALVHDPEVLLLDEPLNGTDPRQRIEFHNLIHQLAKEGRTIVISSHILEEIETLADQILLMVSGKLAASGDYRGIRAKLDEQPYKVRIVAEPTRTMASALLELDAVEAVSVGAEGELIVLSKNSAELQRSIPVLAQRREVRLMRVEPLDESLESVFNYIVDS